MSALLVPHTAAPDLLSFLSLPQSGWELHVARGSERRPALEVHTRDGVIDVAVAGSLDSPLLRGAVRARSMTRSWSMAWGHLPDGVDQVTAEFRGRYSGQRVQAIVLAGAFWAAEVPGSYCHANITFGAAPVARASARLRRYRSGR